MIRESGKYIKTKISLILTLVVVFVLSMSVVFAVGEIGKQTLFLSPIGMSNCYPCHKDLSRTSYPGLLFSHKKHFINGITCDKCHTEFPHNGKEIVKPAMKTCFKCHGVMHGNQGERAPSKCSACHPSSFAKNLKPPSHNVNWRKQHPVQAKADRSLCSMCHKKDFCFSCHKLEQIPHDKKVWLGEHKNYYVKDNSVCLNCHQNEESFCQNCHHNYFDKQAGELGINMYDFAWKKIHFRIVKEKGGEDCFKCHKVVYCSQCHVRGKKAAPGIYTKFNKITWKSK